jgi:hypothetical protein
MGHTAHMGQISGIHNDGISCSGEYYVLKEDFT